MKVVELRSLDASTMPAGWHVITYAELGFAPLNIHTRHLDLDPGVLEEFVSSVNSGRVPRTLLPFAPVSAVSRDVVRVAGNAKALEDQIVELAQSIEAMTLVFDLGCPRLGEHVLPAIEAALAGSAAAKLCQAFVLRRAY